MREEPRGIGTGPQPCPSQTGTVSVRVRPRIATSGGFTMGVKAAPPSLEMDIDAPPCKRLLDALQPDQHVLADKAYDADWIREQGAIDVIPSKSNRKLPKDFDADLYKERNKIERFFGRLKASFRRIATRYEKTSQTFMAMIKLAAVRLWIAFHESAA